MSSVQPESAGTYIYCIAPAQQLEAGGQPLNVQGISGQPVREVRYNDLAAVVSNSPFEEYEVTRENLTAHEQVVEAAMAHADVLPVSFGVVADSDQDVQVGLLQTEFDALHQQLEEIHGRVELGLKVLWEQERLFNELVAKDEDIAALRGQIAGTTTEQTYDLRVQLGELVDAAIQRKRGQDATAILDTLQPLVVNASVGEILTDMMVLNASFLVDRQQIQAFETQVNSLRQAQAGRLLFQLSGPLPPYSFVSVRVSAEGQTDGVAH